MKMRQLKTASVLIAALVLTTSTVGATSGVAAPQAGSTASATQSVSTSLGQVKDEKYTLTLEDAFTLEERAVFGGDLVYGKSIAIVYSVEGNTDADKAEVIANEYIGGYTVKLPADSGIDYDYRYSGEMKDLRTTTKKYFQGIIEIKENPKGLPISFGLNAITGDETYIYTPANDEGTAFMATKNVASGRDELYITIPMDKAAKEVNLTLPAASGNNMIVNLSPIDIYVEKAPAQGFENLAFHLDIYFRMEDGSLHTVNEFYFIHSGAGSDTYGDGTPKGNYFGEANRVVDPSIFKSIIIGNLEYDLNDITQVKEVQVPENLRPIAVKPVHVDGSTLFPVKEVVEKLGGQITFDSSGKSAVIQYQGITLEIRDGDSTCLKNGVPVAVYGGLAPTRIVDGTWMVDSYLFRAGLNVKTDFDSENFGVENEIWYLLP